MNWLPYAILAGSMFGFYNFFIKLSADKLNPVAANIFIAGTSCLVAVISAICLKANGQDLLITKESIKYPIIAGLFTGVAEIAYLLMYSKNTPITIGNPLVVGGSAVIAVSLGLIILKEPVGAAKIVGILFTLTGLIILSRS
jgi:transporter family protein